MVKYLAAVLAGLMLFTVTSCGSGTSDIPAEIQKQVTSIVEEKTGSGTNTAGGWTKQDGTELSEKEIKVFEDAVAEKEGEYTLLELVATQPVAGINYLFLCKAELNGTETYELLYVWNSLDGTSQIMQTYDLGE